MPKSIYVENGYKSREDYLQCLADDSGCPYHLVEALADILGPSEDFDGLVTALEDQYCDF
jgi:hypothetical protein